MCPTGELGALTAHNRRCGFSNSVGTACVNGLVTIAAEKRPL